MIHNFNLNFKDFSFKDNPLNLVLLYGSKKETIAKTRDIDLFFIYTNPVQSKIEMIEKDGFVYDIAKVDLGGLFDRLSFKDIEFTEPFYGGDLVYGNEVHLMNLRSMAYSHQAPSHLCVDYLTKRSIESYFQSKQIIEGVKNSYLLNSFKQNVSSDVLWSNLIKGNLSLKSSYIEQSLNQLNYSLSYDIVSRRYVFDDSLLTLESILANPRMDSEKLLVELRDYQKQYSKRNLSDLDNYFLRVNEMLSKKRWKK